MTSPKLQMLERQMARREERIPVAEPSGIGAAIEELIAGEVARKVGEVEKAANNKKLDRLFNKPERPMTDFKQLPPTPRTPFPTAPMEAWVHRDGANKIVWAEMINNGRTVKVKIIRDGAGLMIGCKEISESPVLPAPDIEFKADARQYKPGEPR